MVVRRRKSRTPDDGVNQYAVLVGFHECTMTMSPSSLL